MHIQNEKDAVLQFNHILLKHMYQIPSKTVDICMLMSIGKQLKMFFKKSMLALMLAHENKVMTLIIK